MQLGDAGGSMNAYPLRDPGVQAYYLEAGEKYHIEFPQIHLYTLGHQGYYRSRLDSLEGKDCLESIRQAVIAASEMKVPSVIIDGMRMNNPAKRQHVLDVACYAVQVGEEYGIQIGMETDMTLEDHFRFLDALDGKLKLCFDLHNPVMYGTGYPPDMVRALGKGRMRPLPYQGVPAQRGRLCDCGDAHRFNGPGRYILPGIRPSGEGHRL